MMVGDSQVEALQVGCRCASGAYQIQGVAFGMGGIMDMLFKIEAVQKCQEVRGKRAAG